jgi:predicted dienelactone hydrolase
MAEFALKPTKPRQIKHPTSKLLHWMGILTGVWLLPAIVSTPPAFAAERIQITFEIFERSISINSLELYARQGRINQDLAAYAQYANPQQMAKLRQILVTRLPISPVAVSQFLYTPQAEYLLERLGQVIQPEAGISGSRAIRAALIKAAADRNGLTLLNFLRKFPTPSIRIDLVRSLQIADELSKIVEQNNKAIAAVTSASATEATGDSQLNLSRLPDLRRPGTFTWRKETLRLNDTSRNRVFDADVYLPISPILQARQTPAPVIVISHGVGSDRTSFVYLAEQLASYGFVVAVPEHPGSNAQQLQNLLAGRAFQAIKPDEFINRPLDIKFLLDELERRSQSDLTFQGKINLQQVGVIGQSFGGYTALALAGATLDFGQLQKNCQNLDRSWNLSLLLQCEVLKLTPAQNNLRDERIKAAIAINPLSSSVFGSTGMSQIKIPVAIVAGSADTVTPALEEQIQPFTWLTTPDKYLVTIANATHFSTLEEAGPGDGVWPVPLPFGPEPATTRRYMRALSLAFFQTYLSDRSEYRPYLSAGYARFISREALQLSLVQSFSDAQLTAALQREGTGRGAGDSGSRGAEVN